MKIGMTSILVDDQTKALDFYTRVVGFVKKTKPQRATTAIVAEHARLTDLGVSFSQAPEDFGPVTAAVLDDTCGNFVQLVQQNHV